MTAQTTLQRRGPQHTYSQTSSLIYEQQEAVEKKIHPARFVETGKPPPTASAPMSRPEPHKAANTYNDVSGLNVTRHTTASYVEKLSPSIVQSQHRRGGDYSERRSSEIYAHEARLLEGMTRQRRLESSGTHVSVKYRWVEDLIRDDRALTMLAQSINNMLREEVRFRNRKRREHLTFLRHQDIRALYMVKGRPWLRAEWLTPRLVRRLRRLRLVEAKSDRLYLTERGEFVRHLISRAGEEMLREVRQGGRLAARLNACHN